MAFFEILSANSPSKVTLLVLVAFISYEPVLALANHTYPISLPLNKFVFLLALVLELLRIAGDGGVTASTLAVNEAEPTLLKASVPVIANLISSPGKNDSLTSEDPTNNEAVESLILTDTKFACSPPVV